MGKPFLRAQNRPGASLVLVAFGMMALMGFGALAVDVGMIGAAKAQARRAAEAGALNAAGRWQGAGRATTPDDSMIAWGKEMASKNWLLDQLVAPAEVDVTVLRDLWRVRVTVTRRSVGLGFARFLGFSSKDISESAAAAVMTSSAAGCLKPYGLPDQPPFDPPDNGAAIHLIWDEGSGYQTLIGFYGDPPGVGELYTDIVSTCASGNAVLYIDSSTAAKPGNMVTGPARKGMQDVLCSEVALGDSALRYTDGVGFTRAGTLEPNWRNSPRVGTVALYTPPPGGLIGPGATAVNVAGFINIFFEYMTVDKGGGNTLTITGYDPAGCAYSGGSGVKVYGRIFAGKGVSDSGNDSAICNETAMVPCVLRLVE